jgi:hypothetical protein
MILLVHIVFGVAVASFLENPFLAILIAFLSHYFLDFFPHIEYPINNIKNNDWKKALPEILFVIFDFSIGLILILLFTDKSLLVFICALASIIPDGLSLLNIIFKSRLLALHSAIHQEKIHFLHKIKIPVFWRIFSQIIFVFISLAILLFK